MRARTPHRTVGITAISALAILLCSCDRLAPEQDRRTAQAVPSIPVSSVAPVPVPHDVVPPIDANRLTVRTDPPACLVFLDGRVAGRSPLTVLSMPTRKMSIRIEKGGYAAAEKYIQVGGGDHVVVDVALVRSDVNGRGSGAHESTPYRVHGIALDDTLKLRSGPGAEHRELRKIPPDGTGLFLRGEEETADGRPWRLVEWEGDVGWVNAAFIIRDTTAGGFEVPEHPEWTKWLTADLGWDELLGLQAEELHMLHSFFYAVNGSPFTSDALKNFFGRMDWYQPNSTFTEGDMPVQHRSNAALLKRAEDQLVYSTGSPQREGPRRTINDNLVNIRAGPSLDTGILFTLDKGDPVYLLGRTAEQSELTTTVLDGVKDYWFKVESPMGAIAWVFGYFLDFPDVAEKVTISVCSE